MKIFTITVPVMALAHLLASDQLEEHLSTAANQKVEILLRPVAPDHDGGGEDYYTVDGDDYLTSTNLSSAQWEVAVDTKVGDDDSDSWDNFPRRSALVSILCPIVLSALRGRRVHVKRI